MTTQEQEQKPVKQEGRPTETQGKAKKSNINQDKQPTQTIKSLSPKAGTATSSPKK